MESVVHPQDLPAPAAAGAARPRADGALAAEAAERVARGFERYHERFRALTRRAKTRFEERDWAGAQADGRERLDLYERVLAEVLVELRALLDRRLIEPALWHAIRAAHARAVLGHPAEELAETFFNSITRRVFRTVGTDPALEYLDFRFERVPVPLHVAPCRTYAAEAGLAAAVSDALRGPGFRAPFADLEGNAARVAGEVAGAWATGEVPHPVEAIEVVEPVFYRRKGAYLVGRVRGGNRVMPLVLALVHDADGIRVDAVLLHEAEVSIIFSFTRSAFFADVPSPASAIAFLRSVMPLKPVAELYNALGHHKHGKTEFYRDLQRHLARTTERFVRTPGARGLVMEVFALPSFDAVFKVIRDTFPPPKRVTPEEVQRRYALVFGHDRAGRLVDAQAFEALAFPRARFAPELLAELVANAGERVRVEGDQVVIRQVYAERRVRPLDLYLREADPEAALAAALDYGQALRDLASTGIFPGDLLLKNFGVTRHGRVVFYDYDELRLLTECRFRELPEPRTPEDELADEPWFHVGPDDVFPEELARFVPFSGRVREAYLAAHGALYAPGFWRDQIARQAAGEIVDIYPYPETRRLRR